MIPPRIGPYAISRELGRGGMGIVYEGQHQELGRKAAVKVLLEVGGPDAKARFQRECESLARLNHPGIVRIYDSGFFQSRPFLALEFVEGEPLDEVLAKSGPLEQRVAVAAMIEICEAIAHAHDLGILHRDLKPANVLWDADQRPHVTDFGLAKDLSAQSLTASGTMLGTPAYMPPEQAAGERHNLGPAADVYGLGATLFALLTGVAPFQGETAVNIVTQVYAKPAPPPSSLDSSVDAELDALVLRCLAKEPEERYPDARALADALRAYLAGESTDGAPPRRGRAPLFAGAAILVIGLGLGAAWGAGAFEPPPASPPPDPAELADRAGRALRSARGSRELEAWLKVHAPAASAKDLDRAQKRLGDARWDEVVAAYGVAGGGDPLPSPGDLSRLKHYRAIRAWLKAYGKNPDDFRVLAAQKDLERMRVPTYVLAVLPGTFLPEDDTPTQDPLFLSDDLLLVHGQSPTAIVYDLTKDAQHDLLVGEVGALKPVDLTDVTWLGEKVGIRAICPQAILTTAGVEDPPGAPRSLLRLPKVLEALATMNLGSQTLLVGRRRSAHPQGEGGFAALLPNSLLEKPPSGPIKVEELHFERRVRCVVAGRSGIYVAGGHHDSEITGSFLARLEVMNGKLRLAQSLSLSAAGMHIGITPEQDALVLGLNRGGVYAFPLNDRGHIDEERHAILVPKKGEAASVGGAAIQIMGLQFLPDGALLVSNDIWREPEHGWLSAWSPATLRTFRTQGEHQDRSNRRVSPAWFVHLPQAGPQTLTISPGGDLIAMGTRVGTVWVQATPKGER